FKQGFGRLIRTSRDRGSIILLDSRIIQNSYGRKFLDSLPEGIRLEYGSVKTVANLL
ncbi:MAG TPA: helicase C-terminal domain-containing protein, partial [Candidatus Gracilibacteria bacterium]|nr:helicase C-terminal domain-containing protein [Candidatus Gracilibacteria bacterium]